MKVNKKKIMVIEDEPDIAMMVKSRLEANGYDVAVALSGEKGLAQMEKCLPDLVVLDVILPGLSGYEVCAKIKTDISETLPVVMLTSRINKIGENLGFLCKADAYIHKPRSAEMLMPTIEDLLKKNEYVKYE